MKNEKVPPPAPPLPNKNNKKKLLDQLLKKYNILSDIEM